MAFLYNVDFTTKENKTKAMKADRKLIQKLFSASRAGCNVDMEEILSYELSKFPPSLAKTNRKMNSTSKSDILSVLAADIQTPPEVPSSDESPIPTCVLINRHAMIQALGKPSKCKSFNDYARVFVKEVMKKFKDGVTRVDVVFDRYIGSSSIRSTTRSKRTSKKKPIRKIIGDGDTYAKCR